MFQYKPKRGAKQGESFLFCQIPYRFGGDSFRGIFLHAPGKVALKVALSKIKVYREGEAMMPDFLQKERDATKKARFATGTP